jgi:hypothetical protein
MTHKQLVIVTALVLAGVLAGAMGWPTLRVDTDGDGCLWFRYAVFCNFDQTADPVHNRTAAND